MPLARLENFLKNLNGNTLYVDPNELDSTDSIENRGNSRLRPFKTIQRALLEAARFSYVAGSNNDLFDQTTIIISPGTHYIDNRPGYYVDASNILKDVNNSTVTISEFNILSNFDATDPTNELYIYNSVNGGVILPKGTSLVATDLRKTKIRPLFVPDPGNSGIEKTSIFRLTGSCYFFGFSIFDGDPLGKVYNTYATNTVTPAFSHHKLTAFEYADGVNDVVKNSTNLGRTDLEMYYYKLSLGFGQQSGRNVIDGYANFQPNIDEYRIVGELGVGSININPVAGSVKSGDGVTGTNVITVVTETEHGLTPLSPILISGVGIAEGSPTTTEYNGNFIVAQVIDSKTFTYLTQAIPTATLNPSSDGAAVKVISDTTTSSSPYIFNCSLKSVYGMSGLHADGSKATGFRSMVTAQFTGISLQKDDRAFVKYDDVTGGYLDQTSFGVSEFLHQQIDSVYKPDWASFHIKASNDSFIQCVSIFAIGYANQFVADTGGDQSITNSNSNFGQRALISEGFKAEAFPKDDYGFVTHIIPPKDVSMEERNINTYGVDSNLPNSNTKIYLRGFDDILTPPNAKVRGYSIGGRENDKIYYNYFGAEYFADITPNYQVKPNVTTIDTGNNTLTLSSVSGISTGAPVKVVSKNALLPDGIEYDQTYFARIVSGNIVRIYENLENCTSDVTSSGVTAVDIKNTVGLTSGNLSVLSKVSDLSAGSVGSPVQWDNTNKNWYIGITTSASSPTFVSNIITQDISPTLYLKRIIDTRLDEDKTYRVRYVVPKESSNAAVPSSGFVFEKSGYPLNSSYPTSTDSGLQASSGGELTSIRNKNVIVDASYTGGTVTVTTKNPHGLRTGNKISIYNLKSSNEPAPIGIGTGTGFNGSFEVASVPNDISFTYSISRNPGTITVGVSTVVTWLNNRDCNQVTRIPPYTVYETNRNNLPYFTCNQISNHHTSYEIKEIQKYTQGSTDGVYHITLDTFKNTPTVSPFNTSDYKFGQSLNNVYPKTDFDNLIVDPESTTTVASRKTIGTVDISDPYYSSTKETAIEFLKDFNFGQKITGFVKSGSNVTITTEQNHGLGGIRRVTGTILGSGYLQGKYYDLPLCGGTGSNATINLEVNSGGSVISSSLEIANSGSGYTIGDTLSVKGIPGSTNATTVTIPSNVGLNFDANDSDLIQIFGATNTGNNGPFIISSVTANTITFANTLGATEATTNAVIVLSGQGFPIDSVSYSATTGISTITTSALTPHPFAPGNKIVFNNINVGICTVTTVVGVNTFTVQGNITGANRSYLIGLIPTLRDTNALNENLNVRQFTTYAGYKSRLGQDVSTSASSFTVDNVQGLKKGDFIEVLSEIMLITRITGSSITVKRALFGTQAVAHPDNTSFQTIFIPAVEIRRPSILRASSHTFEYTGFGPGNYSTAMPSNQTKVLSDEEVLNSQSLSNRGGLVVYTGMNSNGEFFIGKKKFNAASGNEIVGAGTVEETVVSDFDVLTVNKLIVNEEIDSSTAFQEIRDLTITGITSITNATESNSCDTGALVVEGGVGVAKNLNVCGSLNVTGAVTGNVTGNITGNITGNVTGNVTGNLTGNVTGNVTGNAGTVTNGVYTTNFTGINQDFVGTSGYQIMPGGLIIQWGVSSSLGQASEVQTFATPFTTAVFSIVATPTTGNTANGDRRDHWGVTNFTLNNFTLVSWFESTTTTYNWIAIGY